MENNELLLLIEEQVLVKFTGKINVLDYKTRQTLGDVQLFEGDVINTNFRGFEGVKALYDLLLFEQMSTKMKFIVEPEIIDPKNQKIHYPLGTLKYKFLELSKKVEQSRKQKPPQELKVLINSNFIGMGDQVNDQEYSLLCTLSDYNKVEEVYKNSELFEFEITNSLVSLRQKNALKVIKAE